jgi:hypothetical protein
MSEMPKLRGPYELLDLGDGESLAFVPVSWERGTMEINPASGAKTIGAVRIHLAEGAKTAPPNYYDITSKTLIAQLEPLLMLPDYDRYTYTVTKHGVAPKARFTLERAPL